MSVFFTILVVFQLIHAYATEANESMLGVAKNNIVYDQFHILVFIVMVVYTSLVGRNVGYSMLEVLFIIHVYLLNSSAIE